MTETGRNALAARCLPLVCYASRTGTKRNLAALRTAGWRLLVSRTGAWRTEGFPYAIDNGAYSDYTAGREFDGEAFQRLIDLLGGAADWVVAPDIVAGGRASLLLTLRWLPHLLLRTRLVLLAVQDGLEPADLVTIIRECGKRVGIFLGGSTEWKLAQMARWGEFCRIERCYYHVARVNSLKRIRMAIAAGADSIDGSSGTRFSVNVRPLDFGARQWDLWAPNRTDVPMPESAA